MWVGQQLLGAGSTDYARAFRRTDGGGIGDTKEQGQRWPFLATALGMLASP